MNGADEEQEALVLHVEGEVLEEEPSSDSEGPDPGPRPSKALWLPPKKLSLSSLAKSLRSREPSIGLVPDLHHSLRSLEPLQPLGERSKSKENIKLPLSVG